MNFEKALKLLKDGKKVKRKSWVNSFIKLDKDKNAILNDEIVYLHNSFGEAEFILDLSSLSADDWEEYKEPLLNEKEKEYLKMIIKFYPFEISNVSLDYDDEYANEKFIKLHNNSGFDESIYVKSGTFMNLKLEKEYTLEELGLND